MKRFTVLFAVVFAVFMMAVPVMACADPPCNSSTTTTTNTASGPYSNAGNDINGGIHDSYNTAGGTTTNNYSGPTNNGTINNNSGPVDNSKTNNGTIAKDSFNNNKIRVDVKDSFNGGNTTTTTNNNIKNVDKSTNTTTTNTNNGGTQTNVIGSTNSGNVNGNGAQVVGNGNRNSGNVNESGTQVNGNGNRVNVNSGTQVTGGVNQSQQQQQQQQQQQSQTQTATGGTATSSATGGSVTNSGNSSVTNSGNSSVTNSGNSDVSVVVVDDNSAVAAALKSGPTGSDIRHQNVEKSFVNPVMQYAPMGEAPYSDAAPTGNIEPLDQILGIRSTFTIKQLEEALDPAGDEFVKVKVKAYNSLYEYDYKYDKDSTITFIAVDPKTNYKLEKGMLDIGRVYGTGNETTMTTSVLSAMGVAAKKHGARWIVIQGSGFEKFLAGSGWSVGIGFVQSGSFGNYGTNAGSATGSIGAAYGKTKTGYAFNPWVIGIMVTTEEEARAVIQEYKDKHK